MEGNQPGETPGAMLARLGTDARAWVDEFVKVVNGPQIKSFTGDSVLVLIDPEMLFVWFCGMIETGRSHAYSEFNPDVAGQFARWLDFAQSRIHPNNDAYATVSRLAKEVRASHERGVWPWQDA